jgi:hypothetical protein
VKVDVSPDELFRIVFGEHPPAAFPHLVAQLGEVVSIFDQMDLHVAHSLSEPCTATKKTLSRGNGQGFEICLEDSPFGKRGDQRFD